MSGLGVTVSHAAGRPWMAEKKRGSGLRSSTAPGEGGHRALLWRACGTAGSCELDEEWLQRGLRGRADAAIAAIFAGWEPSRLCRAAARPPQQPWLWEGGGARPGVGLQLLRSASRIAEYPKKKKKKKGGKKKEVSPAAKSVV